MMEYALILKQTIRIAVNAETLVLKTIPARKENVFRDVQMARRSAAGSALTLKRMLRTAVNADMFAMTVICAKMENALMA